MKCKECKGKMLPELKIDVLGKTYGWRCKDCDRVVWLKDKK